LWTSGPWYPLLMWPDTTIFLRGNPHLVWQKEWAYFAILNFKKNQHLLFLCIRRWFLLCQILGAELWIPTSLSQSAGPEPPSFPFTQSYHTKAKRAEVWLKLVECQPTWVSSNTSIKKKKRQAKAKL
jgi:hypothetical protein